MPAKTADEIAAELYDYAYRTILHGIQLWIIAEMLTAKENDNV